MAAASPLVPYHARSVSLPSRSHPLTLRVEEVLHRLRASGGTSSSSSSICPKLGGLKDVYDSVDDLLHSSLTQQAFALERHDRWVDEVLDGSLRLLDVCGTFKDFFMQMKQCVQELQSILRRRKAGESSLANVVDAYMLSRKKASKEISKCLGDLKRMANKRALSSLLDKDHDIVAMVGMLREVESITFTTFESLLGFVSGPKEGSKERGWGLVSKLMQTKRVSCERQNVGISEMEKVNVALCTLISHKSNKGIEDGHLQSAQNRLEELKLSIQGLEEGLECIFRSLIKTRVSLLNILN